MKFQTINLNQSSLSFEGMSYPTLFNLEYTWHDTPVFQDILPNLGKPTMLENSYQSTDFSNYQSRI